jgi:hypothetical protein
MRTVLYAPYVPPGKYARTCTGNVTPTMNRTSITRYLVASTVLYVQTITVTLHACCALVLIVQQNNVYNEQYITYIQLIHEPFVGMSMLVVR